MVLDNDEEKYLNTLTLKGVTYRTNGNIVFDEAEALFHLAESPLLEQFNGILEHGLQTLLKKIKS